IVNDSAYHLFANKNRAECNESRGTEIANYEAAREIAHIFTESHLALAYFKVNLSLRRYHQRYFMPLS
ncbi:hypothetical protein, partial [Salmonella enterica]|uniref:hypothetical protein n=1 Tax=Salmonella enterica TaxID=28901 RepID=UPI001C4E2D64